MTLQCHSSRTAVVQHALSLTLSRYYSSNPGPNPSNPLPRPRPRTLSSTAKAASGAVVEAVQSPAEGSRSRWRAERSSSDGSFDTRFARLVRSSRDAKEPLRPSREAANDAWQHTYESASLALEAQSALQSTPRAPHPRRLRLKRHPNTSDPPQPFTPADPDLDFSQSATPPLFHTEIRTKELERLHTNQYPASSHQPIPFNPLPPSELSQPFNLVTRHSTDEQPERSKNGQGSHATPVSSAQPDVGTVSRDLLESATSNLDLPEPAETSTAKSISDPSASTSTALRNLPPRTHITVHLSDVAFLLWNSQVLAAKIYLESRTKDYLDSIHPLPPGLVGLRGLLSEMRMMISHLSRKRGESDWKIRGPHYERSIRDLCMVYLDIVGRVHEIDNVGNTSTKHLEPLLRSLIEWPKLAISHTLPNRWLDTEIGQIVDRMVSYDMEFARSTVSILVRACAQHRRIVGTWVKIHGSRRGTDSDLADVSQTWRLRRHLLEIIKKQGFSKSEIRTLTAEIITTSLNDAIVVGHDHLASHPSLRGELSHWMSLRNTLESQWMTRIEGYLQEKDTSKDDVSMRDRREVVALLRVMIRQSLLPNQLQSNLDTDQAGHGVKPRHDQRRLMRMLLNEYQSDQAGDHPSIPLGSDTHLKGSIFALRNHYVNKHQFQDLAGLVRVLGQWTDIMPMIDGVVFESLLCASRDPQEFRTLLVLLYRLQPPKTPIMLSRSPRRILVLRAIDSERDGDRYAFDPLLDDKAKKVVKQSGWQGLLKAALKRWGFGLSLRKHAEIYYSPRRGWTGPSARQVKRKHRNFRRLLESAGYGKGTAGFPSDDPSDSHALIPWTSAGSAASESGSRDDDTQRGDGTAPFTFTPKFEPPVFSPSSTESFPVGRKKGHSSK